MCKLNIFVALGLESRAEAAENATTNNNTVVLTLGQTNNGETNEALGVISTTNLSGGRDLHADMPSVHEKKTFRVVVFKQQIL